MKKAVYIISKIITTFLIALIVFVAFFTVCIRIFGIQAYTVLSGSMEPDYPTGSLMYVKATDTSQLEVGDVITFKLNDSTTATHRIIEVISEENSDTVSFRTKGDANEIADSVPVESKNIVGVPILTIPYLGYAAKYLQTVSGKFLLVAVGAAILLLVVITELTKENKKNSENR